ncbi:prepilin-type N-terminal cleavage/methylation domain-containing protein [Caproiciproducens sp. CPB-2]|uniref:prepilin-type N-terminal cleavage/methylation domain-containing protein n=1 Tax=Caproiciproducens sp. CPB-2 TaxID=3030017 RepID=UPI0023DBB2E2|nr:prepilin-type N-terminal cleavage/methylation domain-containing protein [Caproiciproducens sp. CPB-2]MDF1493362.1 prepilin-type N-terminal cleavage/methylation domain-containing protein [Caproiciproducens sp. CPB-2]
MVKTLRKTNKKGFTLVELVIVIAILAILAAIAIPTVSNVISTANENVDKANAQTVELALKSAHAEATAGTWKGAPDADALTVQEALDHEGISELPQIKGDGSYRAINGKISISKSDNDGKTFDNDNYDTVTVKTVLDNKSKGPGSFS